MWPTLIKIELKYSKIICDNAFLPTCSETIQYVSKILSSVRALECWNFDRNSYKHGCLNRNLCILKCIVQLDPKNYLRNQELEKQRENGRNWWLNSTDRYIQYQHFFREHTQRHRGILNLKYRNLSWTEN